MQRPPKIQDSSSNLPLFLGLGFALMVTLAWRPLPTGIWHDDGVYLLISKALASGEGFTYSGVVGSPPAAKFPPLYSLVLTPFWLLGDDLAAGSGWVAALNVVFLAAAVSVFARFLIVHGGMKPAVAGLVTTLAWCAPSVWRLTAIPLSEPLFMLAVCLALPASASLFRQGDTRRYWPFLLAFGTAYLTRTAGIALMAGAVAHLALRKEVKAALTVGLLGGIFVVPWSVWSGAATATIDPPFRDLLGSYGSWLGTQIAAAPEVYLTAVTGNVRELTAGLFGAAVPLTPGPSVWLLGALFVAALVLGVVPAFRLNGLLIGYPLAYLGILLLWPYRSGRLIAPVIPFVTLIACLGALQAWEWSRRTTAFRLAPTAGALALALLALPLLGHSLWTFGSGKHLDSYEIRARTLARAVSVIETSAAPGAIIGAPELWAAIHLHTGHTVAPSARFLPLDPAGITAGTPEQQHDMWRKAGIDHILVEHGGKVHGPALDQLDQNCEPGTVELLASFPGPGHFVRVNMASECWATDTD